MFVLWSFFSLAGLLANCVPSHVLKKYGIVAIHFSLEDNLTMQKTAEIMF